MRQNGPIPQAAHILLTVVALWNKTKGGTDQYSRAMEDLKGKYENFLAPTQRMTIRVIKTVFYQAKIAYCILRAASTIQRGQISTYRKYLKLVAPESMTLRGFIGMCTTDALGEFILDPRFRGGRTGESFGITPRSPSLPSPNKKKKKGKQNKWKLE